MLCSFSSPGWSEAGSKGTSPGSTGKCQPELPGAMYIKKFLGFYHVDMGEVYRVYRIMDGPGYSLLLVSIEIIFTVEF